MPARGFLWGAATSAHQVEGDNWRNDFWQHEQKLPPGHRSGRAAGHYQYFQDDFKLAKKLEHNAHRLSLEWSRIEPRPGEISHEAIKHYREVLTALHCLGLEPQVELHHFTNPQWFAAQGGWLSSQAPEKFSFYARAVIELLGEMAQTWFTFYDPLALSARAFRHAIWPPRRQNVLAARRAEKNMAAAHRLAFGVIRRARPDARVGLSVDVFENPKASRFLSASSGECNIVGLNFGAAPVSSEILTQTLLAYNSLRRPIYIQSGCNFTSETIRKQLGAIEAAQRQGADVRGFFYAYLIDGFDMMSGRWAKHGLIAVDPKNFQRAIRPAAHIFQAVIEQASGAYRYQGQKTT